MGIDLTRLPTPDELDGDPEVSFWVKRNWRIAYERDPIDAVRDAASLNTMCNLRLERMLDEVCV